MVQLSLMSSRFISDCDSSSRSCTNHGPYCSCSTWYPPPPVSYPPQPASYPMSSPPSPSYPAGPLSSILTSLINNSSASTPTPPPSQARSASDMSQLFRNLVTAGIVTDPSVQNDAPASPKFEPESKALQQVRKLPSSVMPNSARCSSSSHLVMNPSQSHVLQTARRSD